MKKLLLLLVLCVSVIAAQAYNYSVTLEEAQWDFEDEVNVRPSIANANFLIPSNTQTGTGGSSTAITSYVAYIKPNGLSEASASDEGYNSRHCLYMMHPANTSRTPNFFLLPRVTDAANSGLKLTGYVKNDDDASHSTELMVGYITNLTDTAKANFAAAVQKIGTIAMTGTWASFEQSIAAVPDTAYVVLYNDDATKIFYMYVDNLAIVSNGTTPTPAAPTVAYHLTGCTGAATNPTEYDNEQSGLELEFTLEEGYVWGEVSVVIDGEDVADMMEDFNADPSYYMDIDEDEATLYVYYVNDDVKNSVVITITCTEAVPAVTPVPGAATFEEYLAVLPQSGDKYDPNTSDGTSYWQSGDYTFSCTSSWGGAMHDGFYAANYKDTTYSSYTDDYKALPCSGAEGSSAYCSMYYGGSWGGPCTIKCSERTISGTYVVLAINPYLCIHGRSWCAAFASGDYLYLHFAGKKNGAYTNTSVDFYLADYRNGKTAEVTDWTWCDLSALGVVDEVEVVMYDSQSGAGVGLYACFDNFGGEAPIHTAISNQQSAISSEKLLLNGQVVIRRGDRIYNVAGQIVK